jgi:hypothetical protein
MADALTDEQRQTLIEQFADAFEKSQESYDLSIRTLASAAVAVTVSLGVALDGFGGLGVAAVFCFLGSLFANLVSYWTAMVDTYRRTANARTASELDVEWNKWTWTTHALNLLAGAAFGTGGILLALFVRSNA